MKEILLRIGLSLVLLFGAVYLADYGFVRLQLSRHTNGLGSVVVRSYYSIQEKNGRTEYVFKGMEPQDCIHSIFPHLGYTPCWYLTRHPEKQINL
jgi:hypothetical protein